MTVGTVSSLEAGRPRTLTEVTVSDHEALPIVAHGHPGEPGKWRARQVSNLRPSA
jgi:hypothetical protein